MFRTILLILTVYSIYLLYQNSDIIMMRIFQWYIQNTGFAVIGGTIFILYIMRYHTKFTYSIVELLYGYITSKESRSKYYGSSTGLSMPSIGKKVKRAVSPLMKKKIGARQMWKCNKCRAMLDETYEVNHIIPLEQGGSNREDNLEALCRTCHGKISINDILRRTG
jgi:hypothetical protein